ncbi:MAG: acyltransferase family protein [Oryzihumus sp.]
MSSRRPALDGLRAVAVGAVLVYHLGGGSGAALPGGYLGVDAFFVLSGYLITSLLLAEHERTGRLDLVAFWGRRVRRLFPALVLVLLACAGWVWWTGPVEHWAARRGDLLATLLYVANWHFAGSGEDYFAAYSGASPLRHAWSLAVEEQFYLLWPALVWALLSWGRRRGLGGRRRVAAAAGVGLVLSAAAMGLEHALTSPSRAYYGTDGRVQELAVGVLLAVALPRLRERATGRWLTLVPLAGAAVLAVAFVLLPDSSALFYRGGGLLVCLAVAAVIAGVELAPASPLGRALSWRPMVALGTISYGVYLWHWPVVVALPVTGTPGEPAWWLRQGARVGMALALSVASWRLVERPVQQGRLPWARRSVPRLAVAAALASAVVAGASVTATALPPGLGAQLADRADSPCPGEDADPLTSCLKVSGASRSVVLFGDSTARALDPGLRAWAADHDARYVQSAWVRCTPTALLVVPNGSPAPDAPARACHDRARQRQLEVLDAERAAGRSPVVLVADFWSHHQGILAGGTLVSPGTAAHAQAVETAYRQLVQEVRTRGGRVVFLALPPPGPSLGTVVARGRPAGSPQPLAPGGSYVAGFNDLLHRVAATSGGAAVVVDVSDVVCPGGSCPAVIDGVVVRADGVHFTSRFSRRVAPVVLARADAALAG